MTYGAAVLDHVVLVVRDVEVTARKLRERFGLGSVVGGRHDRGTANWLVPLSSGQYIELLYVWDRGLVAQQPDGAGMLGSLDEGDSIASWAIRATGIARIGKRVGIAPMAGRAVLPNGDVSSWRVVTSSTWPRTYPFFIQYDQSEQRAAMWARRYQEAGHLRGIGGFVELLIGGPDDPGSLLGVAGVEVPYRWDDRLSGIESVAVDSGDGVLHITRSDLVRRGET